MEDVPTLALQAFRATHFPQANARAEEISKRALISAFPLAIPRATWEGAEASDHIRHLLRRIEVALKDVVWKHTRIYWLMLLRRLGPGDFYTYDLPQTAANTQRTAELAAIKYGRDGVDDIEGYVAAHSLPADQVIENQPGNKAPFPELWRKAQSVAAYPRLESSDFYDFVTLCVLARDYYSLTASFRRVGKGAKLVVTDNHKIETVCTPFQDLLIDLYDKRLERSDSDLLAWHGVSFVLDIRKLISPRLEVPTAYALFRLSRWGHQIPNEFMKLSDRLGIGIDSHEFRFVPGYIDLNELETITQFSAKDFEAAHGLPWRLFAAFLVGLTWQVWLEVQGPMLPFKLATQIRRGYVIGRRDGLLLGALGVGATNALQKYFPGEQVTEEEMALYRDRFLKLALAEPDSIDLHSMAPSAFIVACGNTVLVDYSQIPAFLLRSLPRRISDSVKDAKADIAESITQRRLSRIPLLQPAYSPKKLFKLHGKRLGEADLSFRIGSVYVLVDVKAYAVSDEFDRGEYSAVRTRWGYVQGWIDQVDSLAQRLAENPKGDNYDLSADGYTHILPIVCSTFHEYIGTTDLRYYLDEEYPRVAMPVELEKFFATVDEARIQNHRCTFRIGAAPRS